MYFIFRQILILDILFKFTTRILSMMGMSEVIPDLSFDYNHFIFGLMTFLDCGMTQNPPQLSPDFIVVRHIFSQGSV